MSTIAARRAEIISTAHAHAADVNMRNDLASAKRQLASVRLQIEQLVPVPVTERKLVNPRLTAAPEPHDPNSKLASLEATALDLQERIERLEANIAEADEAWETEQAQRLAAERTANLRAEFEAEEDMNADRRFAEWKRARASQAEVQQG